MLGGPVPPVPVRPLVEKFLHPRRVLYYVLNFNFLALVCSEILGESQIYTRVPYAPWTPPNGEIVLPKASTSQYLIVFLISTF